MRFHFDIVMKQCNTCNKFKDFSDFNFRKDSKDGLRNNCKSCKAEQNKSYLTDGSAQNLARTRSRKWAQANIEEIKLYKQENIEKTRAFHNKWSQQNQFKRSAHNKVRKAILSGRLIPKRFCEYCEVSDVKIEAHHEDYSKPLEVTWLCVKCHTKHHVAEREQRRLQNATS